MSGVLCEINWSLFKRKIESEFPKQAERILEIIDECEILLDEDR